MEFIKVEWKNIWENEEGKDYLLKNRKRTALRIQKLRRRKGKRKKKIKQQPKITSCKKEENRIKKQSSPIIHSQLEAFSPKPDSNSNKEEGFPNFSWNKKNAREMRFFFSNPNNALTRRSKNRSFQESLQYEKPFLKPLEKSSRFSSDFVDDVNLDDVNPGKSSYMEFLGLSGYTK